MRLTTQWELATLRRHVANATLGVVEIGVLDGETTKELAEVATVPIYAIDPLIPDSMNPGICGSVAKVMENIARFEHVRFIQDYSWRVARQWHAQIDFVFLDGDHSAAAVEADFEDWWKLLSPGGVLFLHDTAPIVSEESGFMGWPGPTQLAERLLAEGYELVERIDTLTGFRKRV